MADNFICLTCGVQYAESDAPPQRCLICEDERQYVGHGGQRWTTLSQMREAGYTNLLREAEPGLVSIETRPKFAIGQRALLVQTPRGNLLWDCVSYLDEATVRAVAELGGVAAISASHPHFYGALIEWSHAFGGAPVYLPEADRQWVVRPDPVVRYYTGSLEPVPGLTLLQCGGHFAGSAVLHWAAGAGGRGALLTGDTVAVAQDRRFVTFMYSFPNFIPLSPSAVRRILEVLEPYAFDRIYGGWWDSVVASDAKAAVQRSAQRYLQRTLDGPPG